MSVRQRRNSGFTLVEILIVVVILGILAAIVIPQFTNASEAARASNLTSQLQSIRSQLELYQLQHNGQYPTLAQIDGTGGVQNWNNLIITTDATGAAAAGVNAFGPYLQRPPMNPFENQSGVVATGNAAAGVGWTYNENSGALLAVIAAANPSTPLLNATDIETY